jgi:NAD(P)-dependent dehydrogenase (short-subunit alcohol dehydrogenase family)
MGAEFVRVKLGIDDMTALDAAQLLGRVCRPADVARVVCFGVSEEADFVTGQTIVVDGGSGAWFTAASAIAGSARGWSGVARATMPARAGGSPARA